MGKKVYGLAVDFSKAFDKVSRPLMFRKLKRKLPPRIWLGLYNYYKFSKAFIHHNGVRSRTFPTTRGVKQGGIVSPRLFSEYVADMLDELALIEGVCHINKEVTGVIGYADDLLILCESMESLNRCIKIIIRYCNDNGIKINESKPNS